MIFPFPRRLPKAMEFVVYPPPPPDLADHYHQVSEDDPVRVVLSSFSSFEEILEHLDEQDFDRYGVFFRLRNPRNDLVYRLTNFFFQKPRLPNISLVPVPPLYVYRRTIRHDMAPFLRCHQIWLVKTIVQKMFSTGTTTIVFAAGDETRYFPIHPLLKQELCVSVEPVPLLVIGSPTRTLDFAGFVVGMLMRTSLGGVEQHLRDHPHMLRHMSVDRRRKMYDIFPEEFIQVPNYVWNTLKQLDGSELLEEDVAELCEKYKHLTQNK